MTHEVQIPGRTLNLENGEHYAGAVYDVTGKYLHDLVLIPARPGKRLSWQGALAWAEEVGGTLPTRQEQALLFANCKQHLEDRPHWSCEKYKRDASFAWRCNFDSGSQYFHHSSFEGSAVAVRRLVL